MFKITSSKGFHVTFENGVTLSTQFGGGNYCRNRDMNIVSSVYMECEDCEIAIWDSDNKWLTKEFIKSINEDYCDDVLGYVDIIKWYQAIIWCKNYKV